MTGAKAYSESSQTVQNSESSLNGSKPLTTFAKKFMLDA